MPDLVVVGGGPAGLSTAIHARLNGLDVTVLDYQSPPIDKACGEGIMPSGVHGLKRMGVSVDPEGSAWLEGIRYLRGNQVAEAPFPDERGLGYRRTHLHRALVERASDLDVDLRWGTRARGLSEHVVHTSNGDLTGRWIVGADGLHSRVRSWTDLQVSHQQPDRFGITRHYRRRPWTNYVEVYWQEHYEAYVTPVGPDRVSVALLVDRPGVDFEALLDGIPRLANKLDGVPCTHTTRKWGPLYQTIRTPWRDHVALVGDASGYRDAITGEGLSLAFKQARCLVEALTREDLSSYGRCHRQLTRVPFGLIDVVLWLKRHPRVVDRVMSLLQRHPWLLSRLIDLNDRGLRALLPRTLSGGR